MFLYLTGIATTLPVRQYLFVRFGAGNSALFICIHKEKTGHKFL